MATPASHLIWVALFIVCWEVNCNFFAKTLYVFLFYCCQNFKLYPSKWGWNIGIEDIDRLLHGWWIDGQQQPHRSSRYRECHVVNWCGKLLFEIADRDCHMAVKLVKMTLVLRSLTKWVCSSVLVVVLICACIMSLANVDCSCSIDYEWVSECHCACRCGQGPSHVTERCGQGTWGVTTRHSRCAEWWQPQANWHMQQQCDTQPDTGLLTLSAFALTRQHLLLSVSFDSIPLYWDCPLLTSQSCLFLCIVPSLWTHPSTVTLSREMSWPWMLYNHCIAVRQS